MAAPCIAADDGGTASLPELGCGLVTSEAPLEILDGLPPGTTIEIELVELALVCSNPISCSAPLPLGVCEASGGSLGGTLQCYESALQLSVTGTGLLAGFTRSLFLPVASEVHAAPRLPGDPVQAFAEEFVQLQGQLFGDPDFDFLTLRWGSNFGLPSAGSTILTQLPDTSWNVDSFFDITYQIDFQGAPGSVLDGLAGTTVQLGSVRIGEVAPAPPPTPIPALGGAWAAVAALGLLGCALRWLSARRSRVG